MRRAASIRKKERTMPEFSLRRRGFLLSRLDPEATHSFCGKVAALVVTTWIFYGKDSDGKKFNRAVRKSVEARGAVCAKYAEAPAICGNELAAVACSIRASARCESFNNGLDVIMGRVTGTLLFGRREWSAVDGELLVEWQE